MNRVTTVEMKLWKRGKSGWKEVIKRCTLREFMEELDAVVGRHIDDERIDERGSFQASIKINGGYSSRKKFPGATSVLNWHGGISGIYDAIREDWFK